MESLEQPQLDPERLGQIEGPIEPGRGVVPLLAGFPEALDQLVHARIVCPGGFELQ